MSHFALFSYLFVVESSITLSVELPSVIRESQIVQVMIHFLFGLRGVVLVQESDFRPVPVRVCTCNFDTNYY